MTKTEFIFFASALIAPTLYQRIKFAVRRSSFDNIELRKKSGLQIHHGHWGFLIAFVAMYFLMFDVRNIYVFVFNGLGWGLMLDEIIPMLEMPSPGRYVELEVYARTRNATLILIGVVALLSIASFMVFSHR